MRTSYKDKYTRDEEEKGPRVKGRMVDPGQCSFLPKGEGEDPCGNPPSLHVAYLEGARERVQTLEACTEHAQLALSAAKRESKFINEHRYQFGLCDEAIDWKCAKGKTA